VATPELLAISRQVILPFSELWPIATGEKKTLCSSSLQGDAEAGVNSPEDDTPFRRA
jgi:hypothetical protein